MELTILSYSELQQPSQLTLKHIETALFQTGILGIKNVPEFEIKSRALVNAARQFSALQEAHKQQYVPNRDAGEMEGYELGAEWFKNAAGEWQVDDKKASFYARVPQQTGNKWPTEVDLKTPYLALGELMYAVGKLLLHAIGISAVAPSGVGRLLHYHKENDATHVNPNWCGAHFDHGLFTGLMPAYYFRHQEEIEEPAEAGLYITPTGETEFVKVPADKSVLLFQVGEFAQLMLNDKIKATQHVVKKALGGIERFAFALFHDTPHQLIIRSHSVLNQDSRYQDNKSETGEVSFAQWHEASLARYRAGY